MNTTEQGLIRLEGVTKVFYTDEVETHALSGVHLEIKNGEFLSIAGPSGCGKSTLLSILGLLDSPTEGSYWINTQAVANLSLSDRTRIRNREIGFIFQAFNLIGDLTVFENVELPLTYRSMAAAERKKRVQEVLERVVPVAAFWRSTTARGCGARTRWFAFHPAGGRADRKLGLQKQRSCRGLAATTSSRGRHDLHGYSRPALRQHRRPDHSPLRRPHRRGNPGDAHGDRLDGF